MDHLQCKFTFIQCALVNVITTFPADFEQKSNFKKINFYHFISIFCQNLKDNVSCLSIHGARKLVVRTEKRFFFDLIISFFIYFVLFFGNEGVKKV